MPLAWQFKSAIYYIESKLWQTLGNILQDCFSTIIGDSLNYANIFLIHRIRNSTSKALEYITGVAALRASIAAVRPSIKELFIIAMRVNFEQWDFLIIHNEKIFVTDINFQFGWVWDIQRVISVFRGIKIDQHERRIIIRNANQSILFIKEDVWKHWGICLYNRIDLEIVSTVESINYSLRISDYIEENRVITPNVTPNSSFI